MKNTLNLFLVIVMLVTSLSPLKAVANTTESSTCENGECIEGYLNRLEPLNSLFTTKCLPKGIDPGKIQAHIKHFGVTEICWSYITEINHLENLIQEQQNKLELRLGCEGNNCKMPYATASINGQLNDLGKKIQKNLCTPEKIEKVSRQCGPDIECALMSSALGLGGGYVAEFLVPEKYQPKNCHMGDDNCMTQLATGFLRSFSDFLVGFWALMKAGGNFSKDKLGQFWKWVTEAEDHSSNGQLALAKASEDEGVFKQLKDDFPGTVKKMWAAFIGAIKEYLKNDIFCEKWDGVPHFGKCIEPALSFDCVSCKALVNGLCMTSGYVIAELLPLFFTGGTATAAKHGANGAAKIAKGFRLSKAAVTAFKVSQLGKMAKKDTQSIEETGTLIQTLESSKTAVESALKAIKAHMLDPARAIVKTTYSAMQGLSQKGKIFLAQSASGKTIVFSGTTLAKVSPVILYPIENYGSAFDYKPGQRSYDKQLKLGSPKLANKSKIVESLLTKDTKVEAVLVKLELEQMRAKSRPDIVLQHEEELLQKVLPHRREVLKASLQAEDIKFHEIVKMLYPELKYGTLAQKIPADATSSAEQELFVEISSMPPGEQREGLIKAFEVHVAQGEARSKILAEPFKKPDQN